MKIDEYASCDALALAELVRTRQVNAREVCEAMLEAVDLVNGRLNIVAGASAERVPAQDAQLSGVFSGVPLLISDLPMDGGAPGEFSSQLAAGYTPDHDTEVLKRAKAAGLVCLGRTNGAEFGLAAVTASRLRGETVNPWDISRSVAGPMGGAAAAVSAGLTPIALAQDASGSIRTTASYCGLVGFKPSRGRISAGPDRGEALGGLAVDFGLTRSVRDCAALLDVLSGPAPGDPYFISPPSGPFLASIASPPERLKIGLNRRVWSGQPLDAKVSVALTRAGKILQDMGHAVEDATPSFDYERFFKAQIVIRCAHVAAQIDDIANRTGQMIAKSTLLSTTLAVHEKGSRVTAAELLSAISDFNATSRSVARLFVNYDVLLTPTCPALPAPAGAHLLDQPHAIVDDLFGQMAAVEVFTGLFNCTGQPAISLPISQSSVGLPVGMQLIGRLGGDETLLKLARQIEIASDWSGRRPRFHAANPAAFAQIA